MVGCGVLAGLTISTYCNIILVSIGLGQMDQMSAGNKDGSLFYSCRKNERKPKEKT